MRFNIFVVLLSLCALAFIVGFIGIMLNFTFSGYLLTAAVLLGILLRIIYD